MAKKDRFLTSGLQFVGAPRMFPRAPQSLTTNASGRPQSRLICWFSRAGLAQFGVLLTRLYEHITPCFPKSRRWVVELAL